MNNEVFGTQEWATHNINILSGCLHDCKYCYSKEMAVRFKRKNIDNWNIEELNTSVEKLKIPSSSGTIMFPSSHDLSPKFLDEEIQVIDLLIKNKKNVLLVTKPHLSVIKEICRNFNLNKDKIKFRFTIGSYDDNTLKFWEPNAPGIFERVESLMHAYEKGFETSISCEPMLDNKIDELIVNTIEYITDAIWLGKPNYLLRRLKMNGFSTESDEMKKARELLTDLNDQYIQSLYEKYHTNIKIKWKESVKKIVGVKVPEIAGLDL